LLELRADRSEGGLDTTDTDDRTVMLRWAPEPVVVVPARCRGKTGIATEHVDGARR
jgi:hypothetical protein